MKNIVICGYHGFANSGDEALLWAMIDIIRKKSKDIHISVLSIHPDSTAKLYNVDSIYRYNLFKINKLFKKTDLFIFGGGSLIQDITSSRSLYYYLAILNLAFKNKVKVMLYGNGVGPLCKEKNRRATRNCLNKADLITLRDDMSDKLLAEIGVNVPKILITADPAFTLQFDNMSPPSALLSRIGLPHGAKYAVIAVRPWKHSAHDYADTLASFCDELNEKYGIIPLFVPMQPKEDIPFSNTVISKMRTKGYIVEEHTDIDKVFALIAGSELTVGMRLHTLIYATTLAVPVIALSYDPKVTAFMQSINQPLCIDVKTVTENSLSEMLAELMRDLSGRRLELSESLCELRKKAEQNADLAVELLNK